MVQNSAKSLPSAQAKSIQTVLYMRHISGVLQSPVIVLRRDKLLLIVVARKGLDLARIAGAVRSIRVRHVIANLALAVLFIIEGASATSSKIALREIDTIATMMIITVCLWAGVKVSPSDVNLALILKTIRVFVVI